MVVLSFENYKTMSIYLQDFFEGESGRIKMDELGFNTENPPIQIKFLPNGSMDIVNIGGKFITDIELTPPQKAYIANIDVTKVELDHWQDKVEKPDNYELEKYWALTSKMRNYDVGFKYASDANKIKDAWCKFLSSNYHFEEEEEEEESDPDPEDPLFEPPEDENETDDEYEYLTPNSTTEDLSKLHIEDFEESKAIIEDQSKDTTDDDCSGSNNDTDTNEEFPELLDKFGAKPEPHEIIVSDCEEDKMIARSRMTVLPTEMFKAVMMCRGYHNCSFSHHNFCVHGIYNSNPMHTTHSFNLIVIEHTIEECNYCVKTKIGKIVLVEMFKTDHKWVDGQFTEPISKELVATTLLFNAVHCNGVDLIIHSDEGAYASGVNFYKQDDNTVGVIFCGGQNAHDTNNYATCLNEYRIVPDLLMTDEAIANMHHFSGIKTEDDEKYWYDYEVQSPETTSKAWKNL